MSGAGSRDVEITVERKATPSDPEYLAPNPNFGTERVAWIPLVKLPGSPVVAERFWAEVQDALPSRSEAVTQGLSVARNQTRVRLEWRDDIDSSMRVTIHRDTDTVYSIVGGPAEIEGRKRRIELVLEKSSS